MAQPSNPQSLRQDKVFSREAIKELVKTGRKIVILDGQVLKVDAWIPYHPGGDKAILHMVGRDATNEIRAFHSFEAQEKMLKYRIGRIQDQWRDLIPPIQSGSLSETTSHPDAQTFSREREVDTDESDSGSEAPSLIFESQDDQTNIRRRRNYVADDSSEYSVTSISSVEPDIDAIDSKGSPRHDRTKQEIDRDTRIYPSLDAKTQTDIIRKYRRLDQRIRDAGLYNCNYTGYAMECVRYVTLGIVSYYCLKQGWYLLSGLSLGLLWQQLVFTVHDAGHMGITHNFQIDSVLGMFIANYIGGLSLCWWKRNHNVHHIVTNSAEHDPDIQHMPFFAVSHRFFDSLRSTYYDRIMTYDGVAKFMLRYQHYMYYPILTFGRFNLYFLSWQYILLGQGPRQGPAWWHRWFEFAGQIFFWYWFGYLTLYRSIPTGWDRFVFLMSSHAVTMIVHVQITLSHFAMSTSDLGVAESFPQRMLRTTMDVDCPAWLDFFHGGLQFQAIHHLYPRIPRHNLRECQKYVMEFCQDVGIPYTVYGFMEGNGKVIGHLGEIAKQARIMAECQRSISVQDVLEGH